MISWSEVIGMDPNPVMTHTFIKCWHLAIKADTERNVWLYFQRNICKPKTSRVWWTPDPPEMEVFFSRACRGTGLHQHLQIPASSLVVLKHLHDAYLVRLDLGHQCTSEQECLGHHLIIEVSSTHTLNLSEKRHFIKTKKNSRKT